MSPCRHASQHPHPSPHSHPNPNPNPNPYPNVAMQACLTDHAAHLTLTLTLTLSLTLTRRASPTTPPTERSISSWGELTRSPSGTWIVRWPY